VVALPETNAIVRRLNALLQIHSRSLPVYLAYAQPWTPWGGERVIEVLRLVAEDQLRRVDQIANYIQELGDVVVTGAFPMDYTELHDLSADFVLHKAVRQQRQSVERIRQLSQELAADPRAKALAEEALGAAKGHLQTLEELISQTQTEPAA